MTDPTIWDDPDVREVFSLDGGRPTLRSDRLTGGDQLLAELFITHDSAVDDHALPNVFATSCLAGISAVERFTTEIPAGWPKFIVYRVGNSAWGLWEDRRDARAGPYLDWTLVTMNARGWAPDGNASALGRLHSGCMAVARTAGGGIKANPITKQFEAPTGNEAREEAAQWYLDWAMNEFDDD